MGDEKTRRDSIAVDDEKETVPPVDRDQSAYSPARAGEVADDAEFSETPGADDAAKTDEPLIARDNMKGTQPRRGSS